MDTETTLSVVQHTQTKVPQAAVKFLCFNYVFSHFLHGAFMWELVDFLVLFQSFFHTVQLDSFKCSLY